MDSYCEPAHQEEIKQRLRLRDNGFSPFEVMPSDTISRAFSRQVGRHPEKIAMSNARQSVTYRRLDGLAGGIQHTLECADMGTAPVALLIADHAGFAAAALGVLRSGGCYIPLDPAFPEERNARILRASGARTILSESHSQDLLSRMALSGQVVTCVDDIEPTDEKLPDRSRPDGLAYIIFTSGSTGFPKGVMQTNQNILHVVRRYTNSLYLGPTDRVSLMSSCSVTASVAPLFSSLLNGATLRAIAVRDVGFEALAEWIDREKISLYHSIPSLFRHLMRSVSPQRVFPSVRVVRLGGDSVYRSDWELFKTHFAADAVMVNSYGCSEISSVARFYMDGASRLDENVVPVGHLMDGVEMAVQEDDGRQRWVEGCPELSITSVGEILLRSRHLSPGYWQDPDATDRAYAACDQASMRSYRTGDLGVVRGNQGLVHLGRADRQVKLSGFRVEIAEVEACLRNCPGTLEAAVVVHTPEHGERELIGFVSSQPGDHGVDPRSFVAARLPPHMVPCEVLIVADLPSTPNGKIDRSVLLRLREAARSSKQMNDAAAGTSTEQALKAVWSDVLKFDPISVHDDFFALGGNSLLGMELAARIMERFSVPLHALAVYEYPTIREMAEVVDALMRDAAARSTAQQAAPRPVTA